MNNVLSIKVDGSVTSINLSGPDPVGEFRRVLGGHDEYRVVGFPLADELGLRWESYTTIEQAQNVVFNLLANGPVSTLSYLRKCRASGMVADHLSQWGLIIGKFAGCWESLEASSRGHLDGFLGGIRNLTVRNIVRESVDWLGMLGKADKVGYVWTFKRQDLNQRELDVMPPTIPPIIRELEEVHVRENPSLIVSTFYPLTQVFTGSF